MATIKFSKAQFEAALPVHKATQERLWSPYGLHQGEWCYLINIGAPALILVRSSVGQDGFAADSGEDSIRAWLVDPVSGQPMGAKVQAYVTRVKGWERRMVDMLRELAGRAKQIKPCPKCSKLMKVFKVKKAGPNKGRLFLSCEKACDQFHWIKEA